MIYVTYGESPSGVYESQVIEVCRYLRDSTGERVLLVSFVSPRHFLSARAWVKSRWAPSVVLPALPKVGYWRTAAASLAAVAAMTGERAVMARSIPACNAALAARQLGVVHRVCLDGRGAIAAERREYLSASDHEVRRYAALERAAVLGSDFRLAVSQRLVEYWAREYGYAGGDHVVIPCTVADVPEPASAEHGTATRDSLGYRSDDVVLVYSGSAAGWQSFTTLETFASRMLESQPAVRFLMLTQPNPLISRLEGRFPGRIMRMHVAAKDVRPLLLASDYGLMIREGSTTNAVASPTKVAEYLAAGLPVLASSAVGDYADFIVRHQCGLLVAPGEAPQLDRPSEASRQRIRQVARNFLTKAAHAVEYARIVERLCVSRIKTSC